MPNISTMCILLYMNLIWCKGFPEIYPQLEEEQGQSIMKLMQCSGHPETYAQLEEEGSSAKYEHNLHSAIYVTHLA